MQPHRQVERLREVMGNASCEHSSSREPARDEHTLAARIRQGDEVAFRALVDTYWRPLVSYAAHLLHDHDAAKDVVQESFAHLLIERHRFTITTSLRGYLYRVVHNRALDQRKQISRRLGLLQRHRMEQLDAGFETRLETNELPMLLRQALEGLPERRRQIFILTHLHDLSYGQVAEILDLSPQTIANQVSRALASLRSKLAPHAAKLLNSGEPGH